MDDLPLATARLVSTAALNLELAIVLGAAACLSMLGGTQTARGSSSARLLRRCLALALVLLVLTSGLLVWIQAAVMADEPLSEAIVAIAPFLSGTHVGRASMCGVIAIGLATAVVATRFRSAAHLGTLLAFTSLFALSRSVGSHAGAGGGVVPIAIDWLHLLATGVWAGSVLICAWVLDPAKASEEDDQHVASFVRRLSATATVALALLVASGLASGWRALDGRLASSADTAWGTVLLAKIALVGIAAALGAYNRFAILPSIEHTLSSSMNERAMGRFRFVLRVESVILIAVEGAASLLGSSAPPHS